MLKAKDLRELTKEERDQKLFELRQEYFNLRSQLKTGQLENNSRILEMRRDIARVSTVMSEKRSSGADPRGGQ